MIRNYFDTGSRLYRFVFSNRLLCQIAASMHSSIIGAEVALIRWFGLPWRVTRGSTSLQQISEMVTIVVKSFERPRELKRLLSSIRTWYPDITVIVVDDSAHDISPLIQKFKGIDLITLPFNSGVCAGRNVGVARVTTPFFVSLDDDFILWRGSNLSIFLNHLITHREIDLVGGWLVNLPFFTRSGPGGVIRVPAEARSAISKDGCFKVPQFYMARTETIRQVGWDERIKVLDHSHFFGRLVGKATVRFLPDVSILHARTQFNKHYMEFRTNLESDQEILAENEGIYTSGGLKST